MVMAQPIIAVMFERGEFGTAETVATYQALRAFAIGLPAFVLVKILSPGFYAKQDTKTPFKIALLCMVLNLVLNLALMGPLRHVGMALATSIAGWVNVLLMGVILIKRGWFAFTPGIRLQLLKVLLACAAMAGALWQALPLAQAYMQHGELVRFSALLGLVLAGIFAYFAAALSLNALGCRTQLARRLKRST